MPGRHRLVYGMAGRRSVTAATLVQFGIPEAELLSILGIDTFQGWPHPGASPLRSGKAKTAEEAEFTGVNEHSEAVFNAA